MLRSFGSGKLAGLFDGHGSRSGLLLDHENFNRLLLIPAGCLER